ncbi:MAG: hypothetical protein M1829_003405 [Trizodia sp. TS-e1964]|nr:MAG: hypothetical protein M1829_003405 [Trizodia sp. TS-e1964]
MSQAVAPGDLQIASDETGSISDDDSSDHLDSTIDDDNISTPDVQPTTTHGAISFQTATHHPISQAVFEAYLYADLEYAGNQDPDQDPDHWNFERNSDINTFLAQWQLLHSANDQEVSPIAVPPNGDHFIAPGAQKYIRPRDLQNSTRDIQGIDWPRLGVTQERGREMRRQLYQNYMSLRQPQQEEPLARYLRDRETYFRFRQTDLSNIAHLSHFQLRNVISATSRCDVYYAAKSEIVHVNPTTGKSRTIMECESNSSHFSGKTKISTMTAAHGILVAGGFYGEYSMTRLDYGSKTDLVEGMVTTNENGITNHVHTILSRSSGLPLAVFSSNDNKIRTLDCTTNRFISTHEFDWPVNCTATSPDGRLQVIVGDHTGIAITEAHSGHTLHTLSGHSDFGFACDWADDGYHIATGNQDKQVRIYDARNFSAPLAILHAELAGVRSLRFSPVGSGKRVLLMAEPADYVHVVDAHLFNSEQLLPMFGEIGGVAMSPSGDEIFIANTDRRVGGIIEYERVRTRDTTKRRNCNKERLEEAEDEFIEEGSLDWAAEHDLANDARVRNGGTKRKRRGAALARLLL